MAWKTDCCKCHSDNLSNAMPWLIVNKLRQGFVNSGLNVFILSMISWVFTIHIITVYDRHPGMEQDNVYLLISWYLSYLFLDCIFHCYVYKASYDLVYSYLALVFVSFFTPVYICVYAYFILQVLPDLKKSSVQDMFKKPGQRGNSLYCDL